MWLVIPTDPTLIKYEVTPEKVPNGPRQPRGAADAAASARWASVFG
jgi:hypothetical protein